MGIAILMVILYHSGIRCFYPLFMGVDIFLLLSGYRISNSYIKKKSTLGFYIKRFTRIYPLFFILATSVTIIKYVREGGVDFIDYFCNITSLSYYNVGGFFFEWYLCSLFIFYIITPIIVKCVKKLGITCLLISLVIILLLFQYFNLHWSYECAISRLPIYVLGVLLNLRKEEQSKNISYAIVIYFLAFLYSIVLFVNKEVNTYLLVYMSFPMLLVLISYVKFQGILYTVINYLGKYTLELYVANVIAMKLMFKTEIFSEYIIYLVLNIICSLIIISISKLINKYL